MHFQKSFSLGEGVHIMAASCDAMASISREEWEEKAAEFRALRAV